MPLEADKIVHWCDDGTLQEDIYWTKGKWWKGKFPLKKLTCPSCGEKLFNPIDMNTVLCYEVELEGNHSLQIPYTGVFLSRMDKRSKAYKSLKGRYVAS